MRYGTAQKILNVHLKYLWCLGRITDPPHFPVDRRIQETMKMKNVLSWTKHMKKEEEYMKVIDFAVSQKHGEESLAAFELRLFEKQRPEIIADLQLNRTPSNT